MLNEILQYHGDEISRRLDEVADDATINYTSAHDGKWYFYSVDKDRNINLLDAVEATRDNYELFKSKLKEYGINGKAEDFYSNLSEDERAGRAASDKLVSLVGGGPRRSDRLDNGQVGGGRGADRSGVDEQNRGTRLEGNSEKQGEIKYFRTAIGEVFGFTDGEKIYLDTRKMRTLTYRNLPRQLSFSMQELSLLRKLQTTQESSYASRISMRISQASTSVILSE